MEPIHLRRLLFVLSSILIAAVAHAQECLIPRDRIVSGGPGPDGIPALTTPEVVSAAQGDGFLLPDDLVLGVVVNGEARAYPHAVLWWHEIINDVLGGKPILVTFCPLTGSGIAFDPSVSERVHNFGVSGLLFDNNLIMFDRTTSSLWSQMSLASICGELRGTRPTLLPIAQSSWSGWKALYPETSVVSFNTGFRRNYNRYPYGSYDQLGNNSLLFPHSSIDPRLPMKETVLGIVHDGLARAYSMTNMGLVAPRLAINDEVNGLPLLIVFDAGASLALAYDRRPEGGEVLELDIEDASALSLRDRQTGTLWNMKGEAVEGALSGQRLSPIATYSAFWFAWASFNPGTELHVP